MLRNGRIVIAISATRSAQPAKTSRRATLTARSPRDPLDGQDHDQDEDDQDDSQRGRQADLPLEEREDVDLDPGTAVALPGPHRS